MTHFNARITDDFSIQISLKCRYIKPRTMIPNYINDMKCYDFDARCMEFDQTDAINLENYCKGELYDSKNKQFKRMLDYFELKGQKKKIQPIQPVRRNASGGGIR
jgi:hypothetical protein